LPSCLRTYASLRGYAGDNVYSIDYDYAEYWYSKLSKIIFT